MIGVSTKASCPLSLCFQACFCFLLGWKRDQTKLQELQEALVGFLMPLPITQTAPASDAENLTKAIPMTAALGLRITSPFTLNLQFCLFLVVQMRTYVFSQVSSDCCANHPVCCPRRLTLAP